MGSDSDAASDSDEGEAGAGYQIDDTVGEAEKDITDYFIDAPEDDDDDPEAAGDIDDEEDDDEAEEVFVPLNQLGVAPTPSQEQRVHTKRCGTRTSS